MRNVGLQIPKSIHEVTPSWLRAALLDPFQDVDVTSVRAESLHQGTASTWRLHVEYADDSCAAPSTMCLKASFGLPYSEHLGAAGLYRKEAMVYRDVLPRTAARVAGCYAADYDDAGQGFILMEDIAAAGGRFCSPDKPLTVPQVADGLEQLAKLHAASWNDPSLHEVQWTHHGKSLGVADPFLTPYLAAFEQVLATPHGGAMAHVFHNTELIDGALTRLRLVDHAAASCLIHGDAHVGNFFTNADDQPGMADFQCVQRGHYSHDLAMFIPSALDVLDRRAYEEDLLRHYVATLEGHGISGIDFQDVWLGYRQHLIYSLVVWILTTDQYQPELHLVTNVFRYGLAALDHDSLGALIASNG
jgi:hypothetical protein